MKKYINTQGVTLVEAMVALGVLGILLSIAAPSFADLLNQRRVQMIAAELSTDLAFARSQVVLRSGPDAEVTVYFKQLDNMSCYTIAYYGGAGYCDCSNGPSVACLGSQIPEIKTTQVSRSGGVSFVASGTPNRGLNQRTADRVTFTWPQLTADPSNFSVVISGIRGSSLRVQVNGMGRIETCAPNGNFNGYKSC